MKLFKKLAAVALAAVLALSMVGCGIGGNSTADELANIMIDIASMEGMDIKRTSAMDQLAAKLAANVGKAGSTEGKTVQELLSDEKVVAAAGIDTEDASYHVGAVENYQFKSALITSEERSLLMVEKLQDDAAEFGKDSEEIEMVGLEFGVTTAKINGTEYIIMLAKAIEAPASTD